MNTPAYTQLLSSIEMLLSKEEMSYEEATLLEQQLGQLQDHLTHLQKQDEEELKRLEADIEQDVSLFSQYRERVARLKNFLPRFFLEKGKLEQQEDDLENVARIRSGLVG